jgi:hypothetical protein
VPFQLPGDLTVTLNPTEFIEESEPNNDLASAQDIRFGAPVRFAIPENGDNEFFRFRLEHPTRVHCVIGPDNPLWLWVGVLGSDGRRLAYHQSDVGAEMVFDVDLDPGEYFIHVHQYYNSMSSQQPMTLTLTRQTIADAFEPNDRMSMARRIEIGEEARGCIFPLGDHDHFAFELTRPSAVRLTMPPVDLWRLVAVYDMAGNRLAHAAADKDGPFELRKELPPGRYIIRVKQYYDNAVSLEPLFDSVGGDRRRPRRRSAPHAPSRLRSVRPLELGDTIGSTIHPVGDIDRYRMNLPTAGVLHAKMTTPIWCRLRLLATDGTRLADAHADIGRECEISWHCNHPTSVILEVHSYYNHQSLHLPYILENWWEPADEHDALWRTRDRTMPCPGSYLSRCAVRSSRWATTTPTSLTSIIRATSISREPLRSGPESSSPIPTTGRSPTFTPIPASDWPSQPRSCRSLCPAPLLVLQQPGFRDSLRHRSSAGTRRVDREPHTQRRPTAPPQAGPGAALQDRTPR